MIYRYDVISRELLYYRGNSCIKREGIDNVRRTYWPGDKCCDWEVVCRMARLNGQSEIQVESFGEVYDTKDIGALEASISSFQDYMRSKGF